MYTQVMKWSSIVALLSAVVFWNSAPNFQIELNGVVCIAAVMVLIQAIQVKKYRWAVGFFAIVLLFNPVVPILKLAGGLSLSLIVLSIAPFAFSLILLRPRPLLSIPSITNRNPTTLSL